MITMRLIARTLALLIIVAFSAVNAARAGDGQTADDIARFIAGMPPSANSPLAALTAEANWKKHAAFFDSNWKAYEDRQLSKVRAWSADNIKQPQPVLYYMFSGPDFLFANAFFPNTKTFILSGLEPSGTIPQLSDISSRALPSQLGGIRAALGNLLKHGYFITSEMGSQLSRSKLHGTLPVIYLFLARSGKTIHDVSLVALDKDGKVHPQDEPGLESSAKGVKIVFAGSDGAEQTLYYFKTDLSNKGVADSGFLQFCQSFGAGNSFVKAASYLLHNSGFSSVRDFLMKNSVALLQDDTGIPVNYLSTAEWQLHPFGTYLRPIAQFRRNNQPKLMELYRKNRPAPLNFAVTYHWGKPSNLLLALKNAPSDTQVK
ncbi:MAG: hypothetical protein HY765_04085 [Rhodomicrobium sp.]|nr:hypothetical protein [Rhodomicrobium sp.]